MSKKIFGLLVLALALIASPAWAADTGFLVPTNSVNGGSGGWTNYGNGRVSDDAYATVTNVNRRVYYNDYSIPTIPVGSTIEGIEVRVEGQTEGRDISVATSWNNGSNYSTAINAGFTAGAIDTTKIVGSPSNLSIWGAHSWTPDNFTDAHFRIRITSTAFIPIGTKFSLDSVQVKVYYTPPVVDTTPPVIDAHADVTEEATSASGATVSYIVPNAVDAVDGPFPPTCIPPAGSAFPLGATTINCSASDIAGNVAIPTTFNVTVQDTIAPVVTLNGPAVINLTIGDTYTEAGAVATDAVDGTDSVTIGGDTVNTSLVGTYTVTYDASDVAGNNATQVIRMVNVSDISAPIITLIGDNPQVITRNQPYIELGATALDDVDGDLTASIAIDVTAVNTAVAGSYPVIYMVKDSSLNVGVASRLVTVQDLAPIITLLGSNLVNLTVGDTYIDAGATALDDADGNITGSIVTVNPVNTAVAGTYTVTYNVSDTATNVAVEVTRTVNVSDAPTPTPPIVEPGSGSHSGGYLPGWGPNGPLAGGQVLGTSTGRVLGASTSKWAELARQRKIKQIKRKFNHLRVQFYDLKHPQTNPVVINPTAGEAEAIITPTSTNLKPTTTGSTSSPQTAPTKPFWKFW